MSVPIRNLYYLLCYAWDKLDARDLVDVSTLSGNDPVELFARVLLDGTVSLLRRGLDRGYVDVREDTPAPRGKILVGETVKRFLEPQGRVHCERHELTSDVVHNQILKASIRRLAMSPDVPSTYRKGLLNLLPRLAEVRDVELGPRLFRAVQLHGNNAHYRFLINLCHLLDEHSLLDERTGRWRFPSFVGSDSAMGHLFQRFLTVFLRREQKHFSVSGESITWDAHPVGETSLSMLPAMRTDVSLTAPDQKIVIEAKYTSNPVQVWNGSRSVRSDHLYQLFAYLKNMERRPGPDGRASGMLLYAGTEGALRCNFDLGGHRAMVRSLDLNKDWQCIHEDLIGIIDEARASGLQAVASTCLHRDRGTGGTTLCYSHWTLQG